MPSTPRSPNLRHKSIGNWSLRSTSAARGAISACAKSRTASRNISRSEPRSKFRPGRFMVVSIELVMAGLAQKEGRHAVRYLYYVYVNVNYRGFPLCCTAASRYASGSTVMDAYTRAWDECRASSIAQPAGQQGIARFLLLADFRQRVFNVLLLLLEHAAVLFQYLLVMAQLRRG